MDLAIETGCVHPDYLPPLTSRQIRELMTHRSVYPWGPNRVTLGEAQIWAMLGNVNRKAGSRAFSPLDILPQRKEKPDPEFKHARAAFFAIGTVVKTNGGNCQDQC
jgi:hypothetical protein